MFYFYLITLLVLPVLLTIYFLNSFKSSGTLPNAQLVINAWNSVAKH